MEILRLWNFIFTLELHLMGKVHRGAKYQRIQNIRGFVSAPGCFITSHKVMQKRETVHTCSWW